MLPIYFNLKLILPALLLLNVIGVFFFRKDFRYLNGPIFLFILLLVSFLFYRFLVSPNLTQQVQAERKAEIDRQGWEYLGQPETDNNFIKKEELYSYTNFLLFRLVGLQAAFSFIFCCIGIFTSSDKKVYAAFALAFFMLAYLFLR